MTPTPTPTALHLLDPDTRAVLIHSVYGALPLPPDAPPEQIAAHRAAARQLIAALNPGDPIEAMLVARYAAAHYACVDAFQQVMQGDHPHNLKLRYQSRGIALSRLTQSMMRDLHRLQATRRLQAVAPPAEAPAPRPQPTQAAAQPAPARPTTPAPQPAPAAPAPATPTPATQRLAPTPPPTSGTRAGPIDTQLAQLLAEAYMETSAALAA